jgi:hypothetical protein
VEPECGSAAVSEHLEEILESELHADGEQESFRSYKAFCEYNVDTGRGIPMYYEFGCNGAKDLFWMQRATCSADKCDEDRNALC